MNMNEDQAKDILEVQYSILNKVTIIETIIIIYAVLSVLSIIGVVLAALLMSLLSTKNS
jgi:hypothetical protein